MNEYPTQRYVLVLLLNSKEVLNQIIIRNLHLCAVGAIIGDFKIKCCVVKISTKTLKLEYFCSLLKSKGLYYKYIGFNRLPLTFE